MAFISLSQFVQTAPELMARAALRHVEFAPGRRGEMLMSKVLGALQQIAPEFDAVDRSQDHRALAQLGTELARRLDQKFLLTALAHQFTRPVDRTAQSFSSLMNEYLRGHRSPMAAFQAMLDEHPAMNRAVTTEIRQFVRNMRQLARRVKADIDLINRDFAALRPPGMGRATGLLGVRVTSSDPHHGGNRVCILTFDNGLRVVYKPRDVRIDASLVGHRGTAPDQPALARDAGRSLLEVANSLLYANDAQAVLMPALQFLPRQDAGAVGEQGRYGYVQCLSMGRESDHVLDVTQARHLHRQLGQLTALMLLAGVRDLHQTNAMISGGQPCMTDVEMAFDPDLLDAVGQEFQEGSKVCSARGMAPQAILRSQLDRLWSCGTEYVRQDTLFAVENDRLVKPHGNRLHVLEGVVENLVLVQGVGSNRHLNPERGQKPPPNVHGRYADQVEHGFREMILAVAANLPRVRACIENMAGLHVRYHPVATGEQLRILQRVNLETLHAHPWMADTDHQISVSCRANIAVKRHQVSQRPPHLQVPIEVTEQAMIEDLQRGDVPYFTRQLGDDAVYHNGTTPIVVRPMAVDAVEEFSFFACDPVQQAVSNLQLLEDPGNLDHVCEVFAGAYRDYVAGLPVPVMSEAEMRAYAQKIGPRMARQLGAPTTCSRTPRRGSRSTRAGSPALANQI
ncbi:DUF4135 domain-containing protein [Brevifollis gellanilyticus]|uniref:Lantibiotic biosynthesis protein dehydration domain-containing protein n=1 Tax=Brevifollis gellanilyticus TaxID=748831 RepID=A0A512M766_9BACT|nr:DUF4135 domain-containing protein [Brevifollis gellanilyticus]GEP42579.1 hypothetical protein BGE01nite_18700 [Brevifollis gellanilyticus]